MKQEKYFIFDLDGTLVDTHPLIIESIISTGLLYHKKIDKSCLTENLGLGLDKMFEYLIPGQDIGELIKCFRQFQSKKLFQTKLFPSVLETLSLLRKSNVNLSIITNKQNSTASSHLEHQGIINLFDHIIGCDNVEKTKPDPEGLLKLAQFYNTDVKNLVMIGDSFADIEAGKNAGCTTVAVTHNGEKFSKRVVDLKSDYLISNFKDITQI